MIEAVSLDGADAGPRRIRPSPQDTLPALDHRSRLRCPPVRSPTCRWLSHRLGCCRDPPLRLSKKFRLGRVEVCVRESRRRIGQSCERRRNAPPVVDLIAPVDITVRLGCDLVLARNQLAEFQRRTCSCCVKNTTHPQDPCQPPRPVAEDRYAPSVELAGAESQMIGHDGYGGARVRHLQHPRAQRVDLAGGCPP